MGDFLIPNSKQKRVDAYVEEIRHRLGVNIDGWMPVKRYNDVKAVNEKLKTEAIELDVTDPERAEIRDRWPFDNHDEDI